MQTSSVHLRIWLWCGAVTALVAMAGAGFGPVRIEPPLSLVTGEQASDSPARAAPVAQQ